MTVKDRPTMPTSVVHRFTYETLQAAYKLNPSTVDAHAHRMGMEEGEPLILMLPFEL